MCFHFDLYGKILSGINSLVIFIVSFISILFVFSEVVILFHHFNTAFQEEAQFDYKNT